MGLFLYNLFLPLGFLFYLPGLYLKYKNRPGYKKTFAERFGIFSPERQEELSGLQGAIWIHSVSVGETVLAISLIKKLLEEKPEQKFVLSTSTTTAQELARKEKFNGRVGIIFAPIDFPWAVKKVFRLVKPVMLVILETEIWPNMLYCAGKFNCKTLLANARLSDHSARGYRKLKIFFAPLFEAFDQICAQSENDLKRFVSVSENCRIMLSGNLKFDQKVPENLPDAGYEQYFGTGKKVILLGASTHPGEEKLLSDCFISLKKRHPELKLVLVPRHAERGNEVAGILKNSNLSFFRKSTGEKFTPAESGTDGKADGSIDVLLADTTGEMLKFMKDADLVFVGKSLAGHDEGHNLIEPALFDKPVITGSVVKNFRFIFNALNEVGALSTVNGDDKLEETLEKLLNAPDEAARLGKLGGEAIRRNSGAMRKTIEEINKLL